jgi:hypothetical protein
LAQRSLALIKAMYTMIEAAQPITGRGVGYKLFVAKLIASMSTNEMQKVYRLLKIARERGIIPWEWIVDETRSIERVPTWSDPAEYAKCVARAYRRDFCDQQPHRDRTRPAQTRPRQLRGRFQPCAWVHQRYRRP